jgi:hypothetical protein
MGRGYDSGGYAEIGHEYKIELAIRWNLDRVPRQGRHGIDVVQDREE